MSKPFLGWGWFGEDWHSGWTEAHPQRPTPVGERCGYHRCEQPFEKDDQGIIMPFSGGANDPPTVAYHRTCLLMSIIPNSNVHILLHGYPLCRFSNEVPARWPHGHFWVSLDKKSLATCSLCINRVPKG